MNISRLIEKKHNTSLLAFAFPFLGMLFVMLFSGYVPFGNYSMLYSDMYHQYYPFFVGFRKALLSGESLLYNWSIGMGTDYLGLISYYLASPLNLLSVLIPQRLLLVYFSMLVPVKLGLAGMFFSIFLKKIFRKNDLSVVLFGGFYALCAWALGYQWNVMWLDTFALLPLVILGMVALLQEHRFILYTATLFLSIATNYYIGLFTCVFVLLCFICFQICYWKGFRKFITDLVLMAVFSVLAIGMTAFLELPALAALQTTQSSVNQFPTKFRLNIATENTWKGLLSAMVQVAGNTNGGLEPSFKEGLPNLYCGVITNLMAFIYLTCPQIKLREKLCSVFLLLFFNLSFILRQLDYIWHGFHFTNMIPYRFSFLYSFVMLYMAYRAFLLRKQFKFWQPLTGAALCVVIILCRKDLTDKSLWLYNAGFIFAYTSVLLINCRRRKLPDTEDHQANRVYIAAARNTRLITAVLLLICMTAELCVNLFNFGRLFPGSSIADYPQGKQDTREVVDYMHERESDTLFFRAETTHSQTLNDGPLNGYNGISAFTSSANVKTTEFMQALGYAAKNTYNRYCFEEGSPVSNLFLGLKYMIERDANVEENRYFDDIFHSGKVHLLENNAYLPLGFLTGAQLKDLSFSYNPNGFLFQNELFTAATGLPNAVWDTLGVNHFTILTEDVTADSQMGAGRASYTGPSEGNGTLTFRFHADREGLFCIELDLSKRNSFSVLKNNQQLYSETHSLPQILSVCDVLPGDIIDIQFTCKEQEDGNLKVNAAILNDEIFRSGYDILNRSVLELTHFSNTDLEGTISCDRDGLLYTSLPQNGNWRVLVDGKPVQPHLIGDVMIGVPLTEGNHTVRFLYENQAYNIGWKISLVCLIIFCSLSLLVYRKRVYKGKYLA